MNIVEVIKTVCSNIETENPEVILDKMVSLTYSDELSYEEIAAVADIAGSLILIEKLRTSRSKLDREYVTQALKVIATWTNLEFIKDNLRQLMLFTHNNKTSDLAPAIKEEDAYREMRNILTVNEDLESTLYLFSKVEGYTFNQQAIHKHISKAVAVLVYGDLTNCSYNEVLSKIYDWDYIEDVFQDCIKY